jgi:glutaminase
VPQRKAWLLPQLPSHAMSSDFMFQDGSSRPVECAYIQTDKCKDMAKVAANFRSYEWATDFSYQRQVGIPASCGVSLILISSVVPSHFAQYCRNERHGVHR